jgi:hypothetical protein
MPSRHYGHALTAQPPPASRPKTNAPRQCPNTAGLYCVAIGLLDMSFVAGPGRFLRLLGTGEHYPINVEGTIVLDKNMQAKV